MSHVKNVERYARLVDICTGLGGNYTPGQANLQVGNLVTLLARAREALSQVNTARTDVENSSETRNKVFAEINALSTRIVAELSASGASPETLAAAGAMVRKIKGRSATPRSTVVPAAATAQAVSTPAPSARPRTNGHDFASVAYHFEKLLQTAMSEPLYQPQTPDLQASMLTAQLGAMQNGIAAVSAARAALSKARRDRNALLYDKRGSVYSTAAAVKKTVNASFGMQSAEAREVNRIQLAKPKEQ